MTFLAGISASLGWQVISYPLFATGIAAIILTDFAAGSRWKSRVGMCIVLPGAGLLGGAHPALLMIVPIAAVAVFLSDRLALADNAKGSEPRVSPNRRDDPLTNLCVSLPSAVALLAFLALC